jgi:hypothetical protein
MLATGKSRRTFMLSGMITKSKFWLDPVRLQWSVGFLAKEINRIEKLILEHQQSLLERWNEFFNG